MRDDERPIGNNDNNGNYNPEIKKSMDVVPPHDIKTPPPSPTPPPPPTPPDSDGGGDSPPPPPNDD